MLGKDGVMRTFGAHPEYAVFGAVGLSPAQIKQRLDMCPGSQEIEDRFHRVDGRKVVDHDALFNPPDYLRPMRYTEEEYKAKRREVREHNRELQEKIRQESAEGVDAELEHACISVRADYDLTPEENK
jgi:DNA-binding transcriptional MerR regulator